MEATDLCAHALCLVLWCLARAALCRLCQVQAMQVPKCMTWHEGRAGLAMPTHSYFGFRYGQYQAVHTLTFIVILSSVCTPVQVHINLWGRVADWLCIIWLCTDLVSSCLARCVACSCWPPGVVQCSDTHVVMCTVLNVKICYPGQITTRSSAEVRSGGHVRPVWPAGNMFTVQSWLCL